MEKKWLSSTHSKPEGHSMYLIRCGTVDAAEQHRLLLLTMRCLLPEWSFTMTSQLCGMSPWGVVTCHMPFANTHKDSESGGEMTRPLERCSRESASAD